MFENLSSKLTGIFDRLTGRGALSENDVNEAMREVRVALLEADVALPVVKDFVEKVKTSALGQEVIRSVTPGQQVIKIVHNAMVDLLGHQAEPLQLNVAPPAIIMVLGLQGSGKTTTVAKLARWLKEQQNKSVIVASAWRSARSQAARGNVETSGTLGRKSNRARGGGRDAHAGGADPAAEVPGHARSRREDLDYPSLAVSTFYFLLFYSLPPSGGRGSR